MNHLKPKTNMSKKTIEAWVARDENGMLYLYLDKPKKMSDYWNATKVDYMKLDDSLFPEVQWSDEEPKEIRLSIRIKMEQSKIKSSLSFLFRIALFVFILSCTVLGLLHVIQWIIWQTFLT